MSIGQLPNKFWYVESQTPNIIIRHCVFLLPERPVETRCYEYLIIPPVGHKHSKSIRLISPHDNMPIS